MGKAPKETAWNRKQERRKFSKGSGGGEEGACSRDHGVLRGQGCMQFIGATSTPPGTWSCVGGGASLGSVLTFRLLDFGPRVSLVLKTPSPLTLSGAGACEVPVGFERGGSVGGGRPAARFPRTSQWTGSEGAQVEGQGADPRRTERRGEFMGSEESVFLF